MLFAVPVGAIIRPLVLSSTKTCIPWRSHGVSFIFNIVFRRLCELIGLFVADSVKGKDEFKHYLHRDIHSIRSFFYNLVYFSSIINSSTPPLPLISIVETTTTTFAIPGIGRNQLRISRIVLRTSERMFLFFFLPFCNVTRGDPRDDNIDPETETYVNLQAARTNVVLIDTWSSCKAGLIDFTLDFRGSFETVRVPSTSERRTRAAFVLRGHENKGIKEKCHRTSG